MPRELFNPSLGKVRSYAVDEKTAHVGPLNSVTIGEDRIEWVKHSRLLGVTIDDRLSWSHHLTGVKKNFVNKLNLLKRSSFLSRNALLDLYFKIILPSVLYGLVVWAAALMQNFYILWKYFTVGQPELYTTCPEICLPRKFTDIRTGIL